MKATKVSLVKMPFGGQLGCFLHNSQFRLLLSEVEGLANGCSGTKVSWGVSESEVTTKDM
jgi:hypothetical protein